MKKCIQFTSIVQLTNIRFLSEPWGVCQKFWKTTATSLLFSTLLFVTSCDEKSLVEPLSNPEKQVGLRINYDLYPVTIYVENTFDSNLFNDIYAMSVGNDYHVTSNPYTALTSEYAGENLDAIPGLLAKIVAKINQELIAKTGRGLKPEEIAFLETKCTIVQAIKIWAVLSESFLYQQQLLATTFNEEAIDGGFANAITHTFMSNRMRIALGPVLGSAYMVVHEARETGIHTQMDTKNNVIGNSYQTALTKETLISMAQQGMLWSIQNGVLGQYRYVPKTPRNPQQL